MLSYLEKNSVIPWLITIAVAILIFYTSSLTFPPAKPGFPFKSVIYHVGIFAILTFFLHVSSKQPSFTMFAVFLYALSDEIHQFFVPYRSSSLIDIFYNSFGILAATIFYLIFKKQQNKNTILL